jgi:hypothetical protein
MGALEGGRGRSRRVVKGGVKGRGRFDMICNAQRRVSARPSLRPGSPPRHGRHGLGCRAARCPHDSQPHARQGPAWPGLERGLPQPDTFLRGPLLARARKRNGPSSSRPSRVSWRRAGPPPPPPPPATRPPPAESCGKEVSTSLHPGRARKMGGPGRLGSTSPPESS